MLKEFLIFKYNDMSFLYYFFLKPEKNIEINTQIDNIGFGIIYLFFNLFGPVQGTNLIALFYISLSITFCFILYKKISNNIPLITIFSLTFSFSIYYLYRVQSFTANLYPIFLFPLTMFLLIRNNRVILLTLVISISTVISSYYAYFSGVLVLLWYLYFRDFKKLLFFLILFIPFTLVLNFGLILKNVPLLSSYSENIQAQKVDRPLEDWYNFSIKPWYLFIPPKNSTFFSEFSKDVHQRIYNTGYYLAQNYSEDEMGGLFIGWHFAAGIIFVLIYFFSKRVNSKLNPNFENLNTNKKLVMFSLFSIFVILLISLPPSIVLRGVEIYTPSYLLFQIVPFFRALSRWGIVVFLFTLIINFILYSDLICLLKKKSYRIIFYISLILITILMFSVDLNIIDTKKIPSELKFLNQKGSKVYTSIPVDYYSIFWGSYIAPYLHKDEIERKAFIGKDPFEVFNLNSNILSEIDYLVLYKYKIGKKQLEQIQKVNPNIKSYDDIENFIILNFGGIVYEDGESKIYSKK